MVPWHQNRRARSYRNGVEAETHGTVDAHGRLAVASYREHGGARGTPRLLLLAYDAPSDRLTDERTYRGGQAHRECAPEGYAERRPDEPRSASFRADHAEDSQETQRPKSHEWKQPVCGRNQYEHERRSRADREGGGRRKCCLYRTGCADFGNAKLVSSMGAQSILCHQLKSDLASESTLQHKFEQAPQLRILDRLRVRPFRGPGRRAQCRPAS